MGALRNQRHEFLVREYIKLGGVGAGANAYRALSEKYPWKRKGVPSGCHAQLAYVILHRPEVKRREQELRANMAKRSDITEDKILTDYQDALNMAKLNAKPAEMISAATAQAKLVGLLRERVETGAPGDFTDTANKADILEQLNTLVGPELTLVAAQMLGLEAPVAKQEDKAEVVDLLARLSPTDSIN
jgi:hypothetical protein